MTRSTTITEAQLNDFFTRLDAAGGKIASPVDAALAEEDRLYGIGRHAEAHAAARAAHTRLGELDQAQTRLEAWGLEIKAALVDATPAVTFDYVLLPTTGHVVSKPRDGEGMLGYYGRVAESIGGRADAAFSIQMWLGGDGAASIVPHAQHGDRTKWPLLVDAFVNGVAYGIARNGGDSPGRGYAAEFPAEFPSSGVLPWVTTQPNTPVCIQLPASTHGRPGDGVSMVLGGAAQAPLWVATGPSPIRTIAAIEAAVRAGQGAFGNGSTSRTPFVPGHYVSAFFEPQGHGEAQLLSGSAY